MNFKVTLIDTPGINGMRHLALEYSPAVLSRISGAAVTKEDLVHKIYANPITDKEIKYNRVMLEKAEMIRKYRVSQINNGEIKLYDLDESKDFVSFYRKFAIERKGSSTNYTAGFATFSNFVEGKCRFEDVTRTLYVRYRDYLNSGPMGVQVRNRPAKPITYSTAKGYFDQFRFMLREAFRKGYLDEDLHDCEEQLHEVRVDRYFVSDDDIRKLFSTDCPRDDVPRICRVILLTGLRYSEVKKIRWEHVVISEKGRVSFKRIIQKTLREEMFYVSDTAFHEFGKPKKKGPVFLEEVNGAHNRALQKWAEEAGIENHITFESFRRNFVEPTPSSQKLLCCE